MTNLDALDRKILQHLSEGVTSYQELARECKVTRNTIYRRMSALEKNGITTKNLHIKIDYEKLDITKIVISLGVSQKAQTDLIAELKMCSSVKNLHRAYGSHDIILEVYCYRGEEGKTINVIETITERYSLQRMDISVCFSCEKTSGTPFPEPVSVLKGQAPEINVWTKASNY